jgi:hypothetical protein
MRAARILICSSVMMFAAGICLGDDANDYFKPMAGHFVLFIGSGLTNQPDNSAHGSIHLGASLEVINGDNFKEWTKAPIGIILEFGYASPIKNSEAGSALISLNYATEWIACCGKHVTTFTTAGYSRLLGTGNALNFGGGLNFYNKDAARAIRLEVRDYLRFGDFVEHSVAFRIGKLWGGGLLR